MGLIFGVKDMYDQVACGNPYEAEALRGMHIGRPTATVDDPSRQHMRAVREHRLLTKAVSVIWRVLNRRFTTLSTFTTDAALRAIENEVLVRAVRDMLSPADYENWAEFAIDNWHSVACDNELGYYDDYDEIQEQTWAAEESIKITAAAAYAVNNQPTRSPRESAAITPRRQTGGSDSDDSASDDHDSHVLSYLQHINSLICWTSALEVIAAIAPAAKTIQKHTYQIGNFYLELSDYPSDIPPDYSFQTLVHAAMCLFNPEFSLFNPEFSLTFSPTPTTPINPRDLEMWRALLYYQVRHKISAVAVAEMATRFYPTARESLAMDSILSGMMTNLAKLMVKRWKNLGDAAEVKDYHSEAVAAACRGLEKFDLSTFHSGSLSRYLAHWMRMAINVWREVISKTSNPGLTSRMAAENRAAAADVLAEAEAHLALLDEDAPKYFHALRAVSRAEWHMAECNQSLIIPEVHLLSNTHEDEEGIVAGARDPGSTPDSDALQSQSVAVVEYLLGALEDSLMRDVYISKHVHELKTGEISSLYGITQEKVRKYLSKAQAILSQAAAARGIRGEDYL